MYGGFLRVTEEYETAAGDGRYRCNLERVAIWIVEPKNCIIVMYECSIRVPLGLDLHQFTYTRAA